MAVNQTTCSFDGCARPHSALTLCATHYAQKHRGSELKPIQPIVRIDRSQTCSFPGCGRAIHSPPLCRTHHYQQKQAGKLRPIVDGDQGCLFPGCEARHRSKGYCVGHARQVKDGEELRPLRKVQRRNGEWHRNSAGYVQRLVPGRRSAEFQHRVVMAEMIGRELLPHETVHHLNGVMHDNRPENLELWSGSHPYGQRVRDKVSWAKEILATYEPESLR